MDSKKNDSTQEVDLFRDTPVRYMGYANEVGEAFR
jgi:fission process protein 1